METTAVPSGYISTLLLYLQYFAVILVDVVDFGLWGEIFNFLKVFGYLFDIERLPESRLLYYFLLFSLFCFPIGIIRVIAAAAHVANGTAVGEAKLRCFAQCRIITLIILIAGIAMMFVSSNAAFFIFIVWFYSLSYTFYGAVITEEIDPKKAIYFLRGLLDFLFVPLTSLLSSMIVQEVIKIYVFPEFALVAIVSISFLLLFLLIFEIRFIRSISEINYSEIAGARKCTLIALPLILLVLLMLVFIIWTYLVYFMAFIILLTIAQVIIYIIYIVAVFFNCIEVDSGEYCFIVAAESYWRENETYSLAIDSVLKLLEELSCSTYNENNCTNMLMKCIGQFACIFPFDHGQLEQLKRDITSEVRDETWELGIYFLIERIAMAFTGGILGNEEFLASQGREDDFGKDLSLYIFFGILSISEFFILSYTPFKSTHRNMIQLFSRLAHSILILVILARRSVVFPLYQAALFIIATAPVFVIWIIFGFIDEHFLDEIHENYRNAIDERG